ncbi:hypothetical protein OIU84_006203 [Salix udensis]|uniref:Dirigent protein n=1 Tax=Salix udensis TaxID=889485 RepID=A0AAD6K082_9ROSI|nr:hypothetical protein OIU84_006203 [Salix udensis]
MGQPLRHYGVAIFPSCSFIQVYLHLHRHPRRPWPQIPPLHTLPARNHKQNTDLLTISPNSSSKVVGVAEGVSITSSLDGLINVVTEKITLELKHYKGSISMLGTAHNIEVFDLPVVGGTGDFMFVQGYIKPSLLTFDSPDIVYRLEFHLYWPPYVADHFSY